MKRTASKLVASAAMALFVAGCGGGGGGGGLASTPTPQVTPTPTPTPTPTSSAVDIFQSPSSQEFAVKGSGGDLRIRFDASTNKYEVNAGNQGWVALVDDPFSSPLAGNPNTNFVFAGSVQNQSYFMIRAHYSYGDPDWRYRYSNLAAWAGQGMAGFAAFGMATSPGGVPTTGTATYSGMFEGSATDTYFDFLAGGLIAGSMQGSINLVFNFGSGSLGGSINPELYLGTYYALGTFGFKDTVYSTGSTSFSGRFDTSVAGNNGFSGLFTGPNAQELIGNFAFPYTSPVSGTPQQSQGAFIARQ